MHDTAKAGTLSFPIKKNQYLPVDELSSVVQQPRLFRETVSSLSDNPKLGAYAT